MVESDRNEHAHFVDRANPEFKARWKVSWRGHGSELAACIRWPVPDGRLLYRQKPGSLGRFVAIEES